MDQIKMIYRHFGYGIMKGQTYLESIENKDKTIWSYQAKDAALFSNKDMARFIASEIVMQGMKCKEMPRIVEIDICVSEVFC